MNTKKISLYMFRFRLLIVGLFLSMLSFGQKQEVEMADTMRNNGKIYIVVAVCLTILVGLFLYVMNVDRKLRKLEKEK
jgi:K+-transporting ATPase A subunit